MPGFFLDHLEGERALIREDAGHIVKPLRRGEEIGFLPSMA